MHTNLAEYFFNEEPDIFIAGINHKTADIALREKFNISKSRLSEHRQIIKENSIFEETVVISTCNRLELVTASRKKNSIEDLKLASYDFFERISSLKKESFYNQVYFYPQRQAIEHLYSVVAGVDSLIPGEPQIFGQVKKAYQQAKDEGDISYLLNKLFNSAFYVAKKIRTQTGISQKAVSVCYAAKELAHQIYGDLSNVKVLLIGAGETGQLIAKYLQVAGVKTFFVANRTFAKGYELATKLSSTAITFDKISDYLSEADIIIGAAQIDSGYLINSKEVEQALALRNNKQQLFIDLSIPRNFTPALEKVANIFLYNIDDLDKVIAKNIDSRREELVHAKALIDHEASNFYQKLCNQNIEYCISSLFKKIQSDVDIEVLKTIKNLKRLNLEQEQLELIRPLLLKFASALSAKILHQPLTMFKDSALDDKLALEYFVEYFIKSKH